MERIERVTEIENFFKQSLFAILKEYYGGASKGCISKLFLTGVLPAFRSGISPLNATEIISTRVSFHGICGFTDEEVRIITKHYMALEDQSQDLLQICWIMKKYYNGYYFADSDKDLELLYCPELVHYYLKTYKDNGLVARPELSKAVHNTKILKTIADTGDISVKDIITLIQAGSIFSEVDSEFSFGDVIRQIGKSKTTTLSMLVYLGVLTRKNQPQTLRIPNDIMKDNVVAYPHWLIFTDKHQVFTCIEQHIKTQQSLHPRLKSIHLEICGGSIQNFKEILQENLNNREVRSIRSQTEATLQGIVETMLDPPNIRLDEVRLVVDATKKQGNGRFGYIDIFIADDSGNAAILELKDIRLTGLYSASHENSRELPYSETEELSEKLMNMNEDSLNSMPYMYYDKDKNSQHKTTVDKMRQDGRVQLSKYMEVVAMGNCKAFRASGMLDPRIKIRPSSSRNLYGFLLVSVGGRRILCDAMDPVRTRFSYEITPSSSA